LKIAIFANNKTFLSAILIIEVQIFLILIKKRTWCADPWLSYQFLWLRPPVRPAKNISASNRAFRIQHSYAPITETGVIQEPSLSLTSILGKL